MLGMLRKRNSRLRKLIRRSLGPLSKPISRSLSAAKILSPSPSHGLRLLFNSWLGPKIQSQPDVYPFAAYLAERFSCSHVIAIGRPSANDLIHLYPKFKVIGIVPSGDLKCYREKFEFGTWLEENVNLAATLSFSEELLKSSVVVVNDLDHFDSPESLLKTLRARLDQAAVCIMTTTDRDLTRVNGNANHISRPPRWNFKDLEHELRSEAFNLEFIGWTASDNVNYEKKTILAVTTNDGIPKLVRTAPDDFRVVAFMAAYNEEDIIVQSVTKWTDQGISVHVLENWSTDSTYDLLKDLATRLPVTVERFPNDGPSEYFDWGAMLERFEALSKVIKADWFIRRGADEVLVSPWPGVKYKDALYLVDQTGFNCVDHTIVEFHPVDDGFATGMDHEAYFRHFDFQNLSHSNQRKAWKNSGQSISTIASAGHDVLFAGRRVYPFKFLLKHYSFRSQKHGEKKVFRERKARWNPKERAKGWHIHYDLIQEGHRFVQSPIEKAPFEEVHFNKTYLVERLSGIGAHRKNSN